MDAAGGDGRGNWRLRDRGLASVSHEAGRYAAVRDQAVPGSSRMSPTARR